MEEINKQYNIIGNEYIEGQTEYFKTIKDSAREYIIQMLTGVNKKKILDIGCGNGHDIEFYNTLGDNCYYGIDSSELMINKARESSSNQDNLIVGNFEDLPYEGGYFDIVISKNALHYVENMSKIYSEIDRVLIKGGQLIIIVAHPINDFLRKPTRDYPRKELITSSMFHNNVNLTYFSHTFGEYINKDFLTKFDLIDFTEDHMLEPKFNNKNPIPRFIGITAIKR